MDVAAAFTSSMFSTEGILDCVHGMRAWQSDQDEGEEDMSDNPLTLALGYKGRTGSAERSIAINKDQSNKKKGKHTRSCSSRSV